MEAVFCPLFQCKGLGMSQRRNFNLLVVESPIILCVKKVFIYVGVQPFVVDHTQSSGIPTHSSACSAEIEERFNITNSNTAFGWFERIGTTKQESRCAKPKSVFEVTTEREFVKSTLVSSSSPICRYNCKSAIDGGLGGKGTGSVCCLTVSNTTAIITQKMT